MSILPASRLCRSELSRLGNNLGISHARLLAQRRRRRLLAAVNRSLACVGEGVVRLHRPLITAAS